MKEYINLLNFILKLISKPFEMIEENKITNYNIRLLNILYYSFYIIIGGILLFFTTINFNYSLVFTIISTIMLISFDAITTKELAINVYYFIIRIFQIQLDYKDFRKTFFPLIFISSTSIIILKSILNKYMYFGSILDFIVDSWFNFFVLIILIKKYKMSLQKSLFIITLPFLFSIGLLLWAFI